MRKFKLFIISILLLSEFSFTQTPSVIRNIRIPLWAELDAFPGLFEDFSETEDFTTNENYENQEENTVKTDLESGIYDYPINSIKEVAPFLINGMVYGWSFTYTPSDKARGVDEYLEVTELYDQSYILAGIHYASPWIQNNRFNCWCEFTRNEAQIQYYNLWNSIQNPVIHGRGYGDLTLGFEGIRNAAEDSLKEAVRAYYRNLIKNKPKEISGKVLIKNQPTMGIDSGRYVINLDFFLECDRIIEYKSF